MQVLSRPWGAMHYQTDGPEDAPPVVFANSLGTDLRVWDAVLPLLPGIRAIRYDKRGHGLSDRGGPFAIADLAEDAAALIDRLGTGPVVFVGLSIGGAIGQALAAARPDLLSALVLSNTAPRFATPAVWQGRIDAIRSGGMAAIVDSVMERWFTAPFRAAPGAAPWRNMLTRCDADSYCDACEALAACDLTETTATLRLPVLAIAGSEDGSTPPEVVEATARLIPGAAFHTIAGAGHIPCVETPEAWAALVRPFLKDHAA